MSPSSSSSVVFPPAPETDSDASKDGVPNTPVVITSTERYSRILRRYNCKTMTAASIDIAANFLSMFGLVFFSVDVWIGTHTTTPEKILLTGYVALVLIATILDIILGIMVVRAIKWSMKNRPDYGRTRVAYWCCYNVFLVMWSVSLIKMKSLRWSAIGAYLVWSGLQRIIVIGIGWAYLCKLDKYRRIRERSNFILE